MSSSSICCSTPKIVPVAPWPLAAFVVLSFLADTDSDSARRWEWKLSCGSHSASVKPRLAKTRVCQDGATLHICTSP